MTTLSLRGRILTGAVLWSAGLFLAASFVLTRVMVVHPRAPEAVHDTLSQVAVFWLALACMAGGFLQVRRGLAGVQQIRERLSSLHGGRLKRLDGIYPSEVQPLVDDLNALLAQRDEAVSRAVAKAGDLAHGLKTPLAVLASDAERAARSGQPPSAETTIEQIEKMRRLLDYHLAHARAAASSATAEPTAISESVNGLVRTLERLHLERSVVIDAEVAPDCVVRVHRTDLDEMLGNLLDNACRWAASRVRLRASVRDSAVCVVIEDDGPGVPETMWAAVLRRGVRADESGTGSGLGLAIVRELAEEYGGRIELGRAALGGLRAELHLPHARAAHNPA
jgi:signal transduction histidine kinase